MMMLPPAFAQRVQQQLGPEWPAFQAALTQPAPVSLRWQAAKVAAPDLPSIPWAGQGAYLPERPAFAADPWWHGGAYYVQEASSMLMELALRQHADLSQPLRVLDLCGAPGGKATHLASLLMGDSLLVANEVIRSRAGILAENLARWGAPQAIVTQNDPRDMAALPGFFDVMVVDAPCSGEGLFRRDPEAIGEWSEGNLQLCAERQRRILMDAWPALRPGGLLLYSTCTFFPGENQENLAWLAQETRAESLPLDLDPAWGWTRQTSGQLFGYQAWPHRVQGEGFFLAVLRKAGESPAAAVSRRKRPLLVPATRAQREVLQAWLIDPAPWVVINERDRLRLLPASQLAAAEQVVA
ncbi:MAG: RsmB/NOP family class I SAM-dependent RNA methyltransferase, partial [Bacteroidetes bacterium]